MITSLQNQKIKNTVRLLDNSRERRSQNLFVIEGVRELAMAISGGYTIRNVFVCDEITNVEGKKLLDSLNVHTDSVDRDVYRKIAYREDSDGIIAIAEYKHLSPEMVRLSTNPLVIVVEAIEKPGNLGAILRTADAAGVDAIVVCEPLTDLYNPNTIRSSIGCVFTQQILVCSGEEAYTWLKQSDIKIFAAVLTASHLFYNEDFRQSSALVLGSEANGLSNFWIQHADSLIKIPMHGKIDSLNVSTSAAILTFEAIRQRKNQ